MKPLTIGDLEVGGMFLIGKGVHRIQKVSAKVFYFSSSIQFNDVDLQFYNTMNYQYLPPGPLMSLINDD